MQAANDGDDNVLAARTCEIVYTKHDLAAFGMTAIIESGIAMLNDIASDGARHITLVLRPHDTY